MVDSVYWLCAADEETRTRTFGALHRLLASVSGKLVDEWVGQCNDVRVIDDLARTYLHRAKMKQVARPVQRNS